MLRDFFSLYHQEDWCDPYCFDQVTAFDLYPRIANRNGDQKPSLAAAALSLASHNSSADCSFHSNHRKLIPYNRSDSRIVYRCFLFW